MDYKDLNTPPWSRAEEDESMKEYHGCMWTLAVILIIVFIALQFVSCSSHRTFVDITDEMADSLQMEDKKMETQTVLALDSTQAADFTQVVTTESASSKEDLDEVVTEHIVSFTDSAGQTTVTTDRTTKRRKKTDTTQDNTVLSTSQSESSSGSSFDMVNANEQVFNYNEGHWEKSDSTMNESKRGESSSISIVKMLFDIFINLILIGVVAAVVYKFYQYRKGK